MSQIIRNFELRIENVHLRYEDHSSDPKHPFCCGLTLESLIISPNQEKSQSTDSSASGDASSSKPVSHNGVFSKDVMVHLLGMYWDSDNSLQVNTSNPSALIEDMGIAFMDRNATKSALAPQNYVMHPCTLGIGLQMDIRGVELRKPTPEEAANRALKDLDWNAEVIVNQKFVKTYIKIRKDAVRGRNEDEEEKLFLDKFKESYPKFCSSENLQYASVFARRCWRFANAASPMVIAETTLAQFNVTLTDSQMRDLKIVAANLSLQSKRAQIGIRRPTSSVVKKISFLCAMRGLNGVAEKVVAVRDQRSDQGEQAEASCDGVEGLFEVQEAAR